MHVDLTGEEAVAFSARLEAEGRPAEAERVLRSIIEAGGCLPVAHNRLGAMLFARGDQFQALYHFGRALVADRRYIPALANRGTLLAELGHHDEALVDLRACVHRDAKNPIAWNALGNVLMRVGALDKSLDAIDRTLSLAPENAVAHFNRGCVVARLGREREAIAEFDWVIAAEPEFADAYYNRSVAKLALGLPEAFFEYEARFKASEAIYVAPSKAPRWNGEPLEGKTLLIWAEQGIGDTVMFMRYLEPILEARKPARVLLYVHGQLRTLCAAHFGYIADNVTVLDGDKDLPPHDLQHPLMSSPLYFPEPPEPWSPTEAEGSPDLNRWGGIMDDNFTKGWDFLRVGLCWSGNPKHRNDRNRSIPLKVFGDLLGPLGVRFYSLQKDVRPADQQEFHPWPFGGVPGRSFVNLDPHLTDMRQTAHAISRLDLVITVDTAVAHLAASMGVETWILLPHVAEWRWGKEGSTTPWYPSVQLFRQPTKGDWRSVIRQVRAQLERRAQKAA